MSTTKPVPAAFDLAGTYIHLEDGPAATPVEAGPDFFAGLDRRPELQGGRLAMVFRFQSTADWPHWERHPAGDEIVCLLSGAIDLVLQVDEGERTVELRDRGACIVPRGVWHRAIVHKPGETLHVTRGAGTEHRPI